MQKILTNDQIDQLILQNNQKHQNHLETEKFINELMNIDIEINSNIVKNKSVVNLSELTDNIFNSTDIGIITYISNLF